MSLYIGFMLLILFIMGFIVLMGGMGKVGHAAALIYFSTRLHDISRGVMSDERHTVMILHHHYLNALHVYVLSL